MVTLVRLVTLFFVIHLLAKDEELPSSWRERGAQWGARQNAPLKNCSSLRKISSKTFLESETVYGLIELTKINARKNLTCYGSAIFTKSSVAGVTTMYGTMQATNCTFTDLDVRAAEKNQTKQPTLTLADCDVANLFLEGTLQVTHATFESITLIGSEVTCENSTINDTIVVLGSSTTQKPCIDLKNTLVEGSITFSQKGGLVICRGNSEVKGGVIGGALIYR